MNNNNYVVTNFSVAQSTLYGYGIPCSDNIVELGCDECFVFGSNLAGRHGAGAALLAKNKFGAKLGTGRGPSGQTYAIPTKNENMNVLFIKDIKKYISDGFQAYIVCPLIEEGISEKEFASAKAQLRGGFVLGLESSSGRMQSIGRSLLLRNEINSPEEILEKIDAVTPEMVLELAKRILSAKPSAAIVGKNAEKILALLEDENNG